MGADGSRGPRRRGAEFDDGGAIARPFGEMCKLRQIAASSAAGLQPRQRRPAELAMAPGVELGQDRFANQRVAKSDSIA